MDFFKKLADQAYTGLRNIVAPVLSQVQPRVQQIPQQVTQAIQQAPRLIQQQFQQLPPIQIPKIQAPQIHPKNVMDFLNNQVNQPLNPMLAPIPGKFTQMKYSDVLNLAKDYYHGQIEKPVWTGIGDIQDSKSALGKALGAAQLGMGLFSATPPGIAFNAGVGAAAGTIKGIKHGENIQDTIYHDITNPSTISQSLDVKNPFMAVALDVALTRNPKTAIKSLGSLKGALEDTKALTRPQAQEKLRNLLTYEDKLKNYGFTESERAKYSAEKARNLFQWDQKSSEDALNKAYYFAEHKQNTFNNLFKQWVGEREVAKTSATQYGKKFIDVPENVGWSAINTLEHPNRRASGEVQGVVNRLKSEFDSLYSYAKKSNIKIGFLENYAPHLWAENESQIAQKIQSAGQKFKFASERKIPTYEQGIAMGLHPKFQHPSLLLGEYVRKLEQVKANIKFVNNLKREGLIVDAAVGAGKEGFQPITGTGFPKSISKNYSGEVVQGTYWAPSSIARMVNRLFEVDEGNKILNVTGKVSRVAQDVALSGGLLKTPLNFYSYAAGIQPELLAGRIRAPFETLIKSTFTNGQKYFEDHIQSIKELQARNVPMQTTFDLEQMLPKSVMTKTLGEKIGNKYDDLFNRPTFQKFFPALQIKFYEDIKNTAMSSNVLKRGFRKQLSEQEASDVAAEAVKKWFGTITSDELAKRSKTSQDFWSTFSFAPKYREAMIRKWGSTLNAASPLHIDLPNKKITLNNPLSYENEYSTRFLAGSILNYVLFDKANYAIWGKHLTENPKGNEDTLLLPIGDPDHDGKIDVIRVPFLPSIGTLPRLAYKLPTHIAEGNQREITQDVGSLASIPLQRIKELALNENFFGQPIRDPNAPVSEQAKQLGVYASGQIHPYISAIGEQTIGNKPPMYQTISKALEIPFRFTTADKIQNAYYYQVRDEVLKGLTPEEQAAYNTLQKKSDGSIRQTMSEANLRLQFPNVLRAENQIANETAAKTNEPINPFYKLPEDYQVKILQYQALPPGADKSALYKQNSDWYPIYAKAASDYYAKVTGKAQEQKVDPAIQQKLDTYYSLPSGTGQRTAYANANPELKTYWDQNTQQKNEQRAELGLPALVSSIGSGFSGFKKTFSRYSGLRKKKLSTRIPRIKKTKFAKIKRFQTGTLAKRKTPKLRMPKFNYA